MSVPPSLAVNLKRFQSATHSVQRIIGDRPSYQSSATMSFQFPTTGILDLASISILADFFTTHTAVVSLSTPSLNAAMIKRVEILIGNVPVSLNQLSDYGFVSCLLNAYALNKMKMDALQTIFREGSVDVSTVNGSTTSYLVLVSQWLGLFGSSTDLRYLPLALLPQITLNIYLHDRSRWTIEDNSAVTSAFQLQNVRLQYIRIDMDGQLMENLWADRLSKQEIQIPFQDVRYYEGGSTTATANTFTAFVNSQSIDYLGIGYRPANYDTSYTTRLVSTCGSDVATDFPTNQVYVNGSPLSSMALNPIDALNATASALGGNNNVLLAPDASAIGSATSFNNYRNNFFMLMHRLKFDTAPSDGIDWVSGLNTYGQSVPVDLILNGGYSTAKKPFIIAVCKAVLSIAMGKQVAVQL